MTSQSKKLLAFYCCLVASFFLVANVLIPWSVSAKSSNSVKQSAVLFKNLGNHHHPITTNSPQAQRYFDQGLIFVFGFNHAEAVRSFQEATRLDGNCAMCYWGIALALGPNINAPMNPDAVPQAYKAIQKAKHLSAHASPSEQAYIQALSKRYSQQVVSERQSLDLAYANAMGKLSNLYPEDLDAATLFAEAMMDLMPWNYWREDGQPKPETLEVIDTLESVIKRDPNHPGALHYYIHAVEASPTPEKAEKAADQLRSLVPGLGHLVHMPSHIYLRIGRYHDGSIANEHAIAADESYFAQSQVQSLYRGLYYPHNIHFLWQTSSIEGRRTLAIATARKLAAKVSLQQVRKFPLTEMFLPVPLFTLVQFSQWDEILTEPQPTADLQYTQAMWHYARGMAFVAKNQLENAIDEQVSLKKFLNNQKIASLEATGLPATQLIEIADHVLAGKIAQQSGKNEDVIAQFKAATAIQDQLPYMEPPYWYYPVRQSLGTALLQLGQFQEAEAIYREDLRQHPHNGWSLFGLAKSLEAQGKKEEAAKVQKQFEEAWLEADTNLTARL
ncbi:MAG: hypothetical protein F6K16_04010 [Symploca sp. SIO2B6]|nr:hypothetical protein [Symploca sp. SIO2B6]